MANGPGSGGPPGACHTSVSGGSNTTLEPQAGHRRTPPAVSALSPRGCKQCGQIAPKVVDSHSPAHGGNPGCPIVGCGGGLVNKRGPGRPGLPIRRPHPGSLSPPTRRSRPQSRSHVRQPRSRRGAGAADPAASAAYSSPARRPASTKKPTSAVAIFLARQMETPTGGPPFSLSAGPSLTTRAAYCSGFGLSAAAACPRGAEYSVLSTQYSARPDATTTPKTP